MAHQHDHPHSHGDNYAEANKTFLNDLAHKYDDQPNALELASRLGTALKAAYDFDEGKTVVLDYACGTGLIARELAPVSKLIVGVDISQGMVDQFNKRVNQQGISLDEMRAVCVELKGQPGELDGLKFDVITCSNAYHHISSVEEVTKTLAFFLKPGGVLLVTDLLEPKTDDKALFPQNVHHHVAHKHGFTENRIREVFEGAGLGSFSLRELPGMRMMSREVTMFIAKGVKSP